MKSKSSFLIVLWSVVLFMCLGVMLLVLAEKDSRASESENRMLQGFPELTFDKALSGEFSGEFENFLSDGFFARNLLIDCSESCMAVFSRQTAEDMALLEGGDDELQGIDGGEGDDSAPADNSVQSPESVPVSDSDTDLSDSTEEPAGDDGADSFAADADDYGFYFVKKDGSLSPVLRTSHSRRRKVADALNAYRAELPEDGNVFYMMIPLKRNYTPMRSGGYTGWYSNVEDALAELTVDGVHIINAPEVLSPHLDEGIYFPIDHHWSALGAYYLCREAITMQGLPMTPYDEYAYKKTYGRNIRFDEEGWFDIMYPLQDVSASKVYDRTDEKESVFINYELSTYMTYLGGSTSPWSKYVTGFSTGRKALVIGDSFANVFSPYLFPYYDEVHMTDVRANHFSAEKCGGWIAELMEYHGIDDVYIVMSYANAVNSDTSCQRLERCLHG